MEVSHKITPVNVTGGFDYYEARLCVTSEVRETQAVLIVGKKSHLYLCVHEELT